MRPDSGLRPLPWRCSLPGALATLRSQRSTSPLVVRRLGSPDFAVSRGVGILLDRTARALTLRHTGKSARCARRTRAANRNPCPPLGLTGRRRAGNAPSVEEARSHEPCNNLKTSVLLFDVAKCL